jgi:hypothetical protein
MAERRPTFRDFGVIPAGLPEPAEVVRCFFSRGRVMGQYLATAVVAVVGLGLSILAALFLTSPLNLLGCAAFVAAFGVFVCMVTRNDYGLIELQGETLRAKHLYSGRTIERSISDVDSIESILIRSTHLETAVIAAMFGRIKGVDVQFRGGFSLRIQRSDPAMTNAEEMIQGILYRMKQQEELEFDILELEGQPALKRVYRKRAAPVSAKKRDRNVLLIAIMTLLLFMGGVFAFWWQQENEKLIVVAQPPHKLSLRDLIRSGPGANRHLTITDFETGGFVYESRGGAWTSVWVALFPPEQPSNRPADEIEVVLSSKQIRDEATLQRLLRPGQVTGICSATRSTSWGVTLGPRLVESNPGSKLNSAWRFEYVENTPTLQFVSILPASSTGCFVSALILAAAIGYRNFWNGANSRADQAFV